MAEVADIVDYLREGAKNSAADPAEYLSENALRVLERRYLIKDENGKLTETAQDMFRRVAKNIAFAEGKYGDEKEVLVAEEAFYNVMARAEFLPNSPTLMNAGRDLQQLSACFVLPVGDSMESIFDAVRDTALIHKSGGGTGFSFSKLRPSGSRVKSTSGVSSGPVSFMKVFDAATESVKQGGTRRGANMGILRVDHPDIEEFIDCKKGMTEFTNFNISVALTDAFMGAVEKDGEYDLVSPANNEVTGRLKAREVFDKIIASAWGNGDPGIVFIDRINRDNPTPHIGEMESTNPCGEQPLLPYESCNLGSINLSTMVDKEKNVVDWAKLKMVTHIAVRFLDDVIDQNNYPIDKIGENTRANRKIGLGVMGWADMLIKLNIAYNSEAAIKLASEVMAYIDIESKKASRDLAKVRGPFPNYAGSTYDKPDAEPIRNATTTTIAPTGTISIIAGASSGVEPLFALSYIRTVMDKDKLVEVNPLFKKAAIEQGFYSEELMERVAYEGHIEKETGLPQETQETFVTAHGVSPEWHLRMQAAFQLSTDNAVSKTVNFSNEATIDDVKNVYELAYQLGCKGVTIYRDGSRDAQVLSTGSTYAKEEEAPKEAKAAEEIHKPKPRPEVMEGYTQKINTGCGPMYVTINHDHETGKAFELFTQIGKAGGCAASQNESIGRLVSLALRSGVEVDEVRKQLLGISCHQPAWEKGAKIYSCADAISKAIGRWQKAREHHDAAEGEEVKSNGNGNGNGSTAPAAPMSHAPLREVKSYAAAMVGGACPDCGSGLEHVEGCLKCGGCGYTKC